MTHEQFVALMRSVFPDGRWDESEDGELIIHTGLVCTGDEDAPIIPMKEAKEIEEILTLIRPTGLWSSPDGSPGVLD